MSPPADSEHRGRTRMNAAFRNATFTDTLAAFQDGDFPLALQRLQALLNLAPGGGPNWFALLGNIHFKLGNKEEAGDAFAREAAVSPDKAAQFLKLAMALFAGAGATSKIRSLAVQALPVLSYDPAAMYQLGEACLAAGDMDGMEKVLHLLDNRNPQHVALKCSYFRHKGNRDALWRTLEQGMVQCPNDVSLKSLRYAEARLICAFDVMREHQAIMETPDAPLANALLCAEKALDRLHWCSSEAVMARPSADSNRLLAETDALSLLRHPRRPISPAGKPLKVAYLSDDFRQHSVMSVLSDVLKHHDRDRVELTLLCHGMAENRAPERGNLTPELNAAVTSIEGRPTVEVLDLIRRLEIDVLVDLKGHTAGARLDIVNLADTPVKVGYLGYPSTVTGAELDYVITDAITTPQESRPHYTERFCILPHTSMPNAALETCIPREATRAEWGLPEDRFVFSSFNALQKISPQTIDVWSEVLSQVPDSLLWIRMADTMARENLIRELRRKSVSGDRVIFAESTRSYQDHISRAALADLSLDTLPYNGHATTADMLRAGVPVVTMRGTTAPSRMSASLLHAVGLPDLVGENEAGYVGIAVTLATDRTLYRAMRERLARNRLSSPLFDPARFARSLESAFELMAQRARLGLQPDVIEVPSPTPARVLRRAEAA